MLTTMASTEPPKEYYSTSEVAQMLSRSDWTVREWCRLGRIWAEKRDSGRGVSKEWKISHEELLRIKNEGLLPL
ncbi:MAG: helix-turn-helix domain-containing protein [Pirellulaceae bacterium]